jgi:hypothetical protein
VSHGPCHMGAAHGTMDTASNPHPPGAHICRRVMTRPSSPVISAMAFMPLFPPFAVAALETCPVMLPSRPAFAPLDLPPLPLHSASSLPACQSTCLPVCLPTSLPLSQPRLIRTVDQHKPNGTHPALLVHLARRGHRPPRPPPTLMRLTHSPCHQSAPAPAPAPPPPAPQTPPAQLVLVGLNWCWLGSTDSPRCT